MKIEYDYIEPVYKVLVNNLEKFERVEEKFYDDGSIRLKIIVENEIFRGFHRMIRKETTDKVIPRTYTETSSI